MSLSLQEQFGPSGKCFGCGPKNEHGLQIKSYPQEGGDVIATFTPKIHHEAFEGVVNGGIIGALLDCHSNWTAAYSIMKHRSAESIPWTVTAEYKVSLFYPTPSNQTLDIHAKATKVEDNRAWILAEMFVEGQKMAACEGIFVAVKEGHPAHRRWE